MWDEAVKQNRSQPHFDQDLYNNMKRQGILLQDFLNEQINALRYKDKELKVIDPVLAEVVDSGLALDVLAFHTTPLGSAEQRTTEQLAREYSHRQDVFPALVQKCKDLYLLVDPAADKLDEALATATRLTHDTLAPLVRKQFDESDKPGQRAARILSSKHTNFKADEDSVLLDEADIALVEIGRNSMRQLTDLEQSLVTRSQERQRLNRMREQEMMEKLKYSDAEVAKRLQELGYYDRDKNPNGKGIEHQYEPVERHGEKLVVDHATGLTWQQAGSKNEMNYADAEKYIRDLNDQKFAGYNDWHLSTLEEAMALMEPLKMNGDLYILYIDPVFDPTQQYIWTASKMSAGMAWDVGFSSGYCLSINVGGHVYVRAVRSGQSII